MLVLFFIIVFIAEIIVASKFIEIIKKYDEKVCAANTQITSLQPKLNKTMLCARIEVNKLLLNITELQIKLKKKKEEYKIIVFKNVLTAICFLILNYNAKRTLTTIELLISVKDFFDTFRKVNNSLKK